MFSAPFDNRFIDFLSNTSRNPLRLGRGQGPFLSPRFFFSLRLALGGAVEVAIGHVLVLDILFDDIERRTTAGDDTVGR